jgi:hypothetical protein
VKPKKKTTRKRKSFFAPPDSDDEDNESRLSFRSPSRSVSPVGTMPVTLPLSSSVPAQFSGGVSGTSQSDTMEDNGKLVDNTTTTQAKADNLRNNVGDDCVVRAFQESVSTLVPIQSSPRGSMHAPAFQAAASVPSRPPAGTSSDALGGHVSMPALYSFGAGVPTTSSYQSGPSTHRSSGYSSGGIPQYPSYSGQMRSFPVSTQVSKLPPALTNNNK